YGRAVGTLLQHGGLDRVEDDRLGRGRQRLPERRRPVANDVDLCEELTWLAEDVLDRPRREWAQFPRAVREPDRRGPDDLDRGPHRHGQPLLPGPGHERSYVLHL